MKMKHWGTSGGLLAHTRFPESRFGAGADRDFRIFDTNWIWSSFFSNF